MSTIIKICGLTNQSDIQYTVENDASMIGIVLHPSSHRYVEPTQAVSLEKFAKTISKNIKTVAVAKHYKDVQNLSTQFDFIQIPLTNNIETINNHPKNTLYSFHTKDEFDVIKQKTDIKPLFDASHGSGNSFDSPDWLLPHLSEVIIAGGLTPDNVAFIMEKYHPYGVDVSSGVEENKTKSQDLISKFIDNVKTLH